MEDDGRMRKVRVVLEKKSGWKELLPDVTDGLQPFQNGELNKRRQQDINDLFRYHSLPGVKTKAWASNRLLSRSTRQHSSRRSMRDGISSHGSLGLSLLSLGAARLFSRRTCGASTLTEFGNHFTRYCEETTTPEKEVRGLTTCAWPTIDAPATIETDSLLCPAEREKRETRVPDQGWAEKALARHGVSDTFGWFFWSAGSFQDHRRHLFGRDANPASTP